LKCDAAAVVDVVAVDVRGGAVARCGGKLLHWNPRNPPTFVVVMVLLRYSIDTHTTNTVDDQCIVSYLHFHPDAVKMNQSNTSAYDVHHHRCCRRKDDCSISVILE
jgi:hypothetical protein